MKHEHDDRWLHDIEPPLADRRMVVAMFVLVCLTVIVGAVFALELRHEVADRLAMVFAR